MYRSCLACIEVLDDFRRISGKAQVIENLQEIVMINGVKCLGEIDKQEVEVLFGK